MPTLSAAARTSTWTLVAALTLGAAFVRAAPLPPLPVRVEPLELCGTCALDRAPSDFAERLRGVLDSSRALRFDSAASSVLALAADTSSVPCPLALSFRDRLGVVTVSDTADLAVDGVLDSLLARLERAVVSARSATIDVFTEPAGASVRLDGAEAGATPLRLERLLPGSIPLAISFDGWADVAETLSVAPGEVRSVERRLARSQAWLDSVHRDSLWRDARERPARDLPELYDRLALAVATDPWVSVVVLPFETRGTGPDEYDAGLAAAEYGIARWKRDPRFVVLRRELVRRHVRSGAFAASATAADTAVAAMGRVVSARYVVTGTVAMEDGRRRFEARMVSVRTGRIVGAATAEQSTESVETLLSDALGEPAWFPAVVSRSAVAPGWGQLHAGRPFRALVACGAVAAAAGFSLWAWSDFSDKDDALQDYRDHDPSTVVAGEERGGWWRRAEAARLDRNDAATVFGVSLGVFGLVWAANVADAAIIGRHEARRVRSRYYAAVPQPMLGPDGMALAWRF